MADLFANKYLKDIHDQSKPAVINFVNLKYNILLKKFLISKSEQKFNDILEFLEKNIDSF